MTAPGNERRRESRLQLNLPVRVRGFESDGTSWEAVTATEDCSAAGAAFTLVQAVRTGQVLQLALPLPRSLRQHDHFEASYRVYALVRHVDRGEQVSRIGVMFYGKAPPRGFDKNPAARFLLPSDVPSPIPDPATADEAVAPRPPPAPEPEPDPDPGGMRKHERYEIFVNFTLLEQDEFGVVLREEVTVAENISLGGARVMTALNFASGDIVLMEEVGGPFKTRAEVRHAFLGVDRIRRLNLMFLDGRQPEHLLRKR